MAISKEELLQDLLNTFRDEAADHLNTINQALLQMERAEDDTHRQQQLQEAFRASHSLKGAARAVSMEEIEGLAHDMETVLQLARDSHIALDADTCDLLYKTLDTVEALLRGESPPLITLREQLGALNKPDDDEEGHPAVTVEAEPAPRFNGGEETIRVSVNKLDDLMAQIGELLVAKISADQRLADTRNIHYQLAQWPKTWREINTLLPDTDNGNGSGRKLAEVLQRHAEHMQSLTEAFVTFNQSFGSDTVRLGMVTNDLQDRVRQVRMVPFQSLALVLERAVRDVAHSEGKQVNFRIDGNDVELDKQVLETLKDPLMHLLRNAVDHGVETPDIREAAGKSPVGSVVLSVQQHGSEVRIKVMDDGQGFDREALLEAHHQRNGGSLPENLADDEIMSLAFLPGISTAQRVTPISGRGMGLDVVRQRIENIQGRIAVENHPGEGVSVRLVVPTSLAMTRGLLVRAGQEGYIIPLLSVEKIIEPDDAFVVSGKWMLNVDEAAVPLVSLAQVLERPSALRDEKVSRPIAVVIGVSDQRLAILVDDVVTEQELAVKPLGEPLKRVRNVTGAALLGSGEPVVVLNPADLVKSARGTGTLTTMPTVVDKDEDTEAVCYSILVVDDSITTRTLEKNILTAAGFDVTTATDGTEALKRLDEKPIDLVVADVQMPHMDGISLTQELRSSPKYQTMPIILVTSLESPEDREKGMVAGANAYIIKRGFDQAELLATIERLL